VRFGEVPPGWDSPEAKRAQRIQEAIYIMTPDEIASKISELQRSVEEARKEAKAAAERANDALRYLRNLSTGLDADIPGSAREVSNAIDVKYAKL
jgi:hypothetical protein